MSRQPEPRQSFADWFAGGLAWELTNFVIAIPLMISVFVASRVLSWSFDRTIWALVIASILYRLLLWAVRKIRRNA